MTHQDGGATRNVSAGAHRTSSADRTSPSAPRYATNPATSASRHQTSLSGTTAIPATCATAMSGMARKFSTRPAKVTREKNSAPTGKSAASVAADATNSDAGASSQRGSASVMESATKRMASVAPNVRMNA